MDAQQRIVELEMISANAEKEIKKIRANEFKALMKPLEEKYLNRYFIIGNYEYVYVTSIYDDRHVYTTSAYLGNSLEVSKENLTMIQDLEEEVTKQDMVNFINKHISDFIDCLS